MPRVNAWNAEHGFPELEMGVGVNTGEVVAGNIGSRKRAKYGVVGSNVNLAGRIEAYTLGGQVLVSGATRDAVKAPLTILSTRTVEPKGVAQPIALHEVGGLGGDYGLELPRRAVRWTDVEPAVPVTFRWVTGKEVVGDEQDGLLVRLAAEEAEIRSPTPPPPFTDLKVLLTPEGAETVPGIYGKVIARLDKDGSFVLRFTAVPQDARRYLDAVAGRRVP